MLHKSYSTESGAVWLYGASEGLLYYGQWLCHSGKVENMRLVKIVANAG